MSPWGDFRVGRLVGMLSRYPDDTLVRVLVRFPDIDYELEDLAFEVCESLSGPRIVSCVHDTDFDDPGVAERLRRAAERVAYNNFVD